MCHVADDTGRLLQIALGICTDVVAVDVLWRLAVGAVPLGTSHLLRPPGIYAGGRENILLQMSILWLAFAQWTGHARPCSDLSSLLEADLQKANRKL